MNFSFDHIDFSKLSNNKLDNKELEKNNSIKFDKTTTEIYRMKRLFKIDPITDIKVSEEFAFKFYNSWNPYTGIRNNNDEIGPLYFNAITLYDFYFINRYKGLWNPPSEQYQGYYGELLGTGKNIKIKSRGYNPEKYLYRLPIIDCYLPKNHNFSIITIGPELNNNEIEQIDNIILKLHPKKTLNNFTTLSQLKFYYDKALDPSPDQNCSEIKILKEKYKDLSCIEINDKYNRYWVDKLINIKY